MDNEILRITHCADIQVKDRNIPLFKPSESMLKEIEQYLEKEKIQIHIISGDLFEFVNANDSERKLIYNHIARLIAIDTLEEIIIIAGNHDLMKENKAQYSLDSEQKDLNPVVLFTDVAKYFDSEKVRYFSTSGIYNSNVKPEIQYCVYSLEDTEGWDNLKLQVKPGITFCLYHAMIQEYVDSVKLPVRPDIYNKLSNMSLFPDNSIIAAGDIHKTLCFESDGNKKFFYPGSTMQHTFGEGTYINVGNEYSIKNADNKYLMEYSINKQATNINQVVCYSKELKDYISYVTITLDSTVPYTVIKNLLQTNLNFRAGIDSTIIRIKSSNIFISKEKEIYGIIRDFCPSARIEFEYDKFIQQQTYSGNSVLQEVIEQKAEEIRNEQTSTDTNANMATGNLDNLLLSEEQLSKLFDSVLIKLVQGVSDSFDDAITEKDIQSEILSLFQTELHKTTEQSSARYNIKFKSIETNGFMFLGANRIDLDIPGIVRILGTNGIGKTTLYRMIRWTINGMAFENMAQNQVVKNNLLVFNNKLIDNDFVMNKMSLDINGQEVVISRMVTRTWKQNTTDEQKLEQNWMDYIANVKRDFKLDIVAINGEIKTYIGEQAEKTVLRWFGSTVDNILFLNQAKIETILKSNPDKLNELILQYIGVDYLKKLEDNLEQAKETLMSIDKPKRNREAIHEAIVDTDLFIDKVLSDLKDKTIQVQTYEENQTKLETVIQQYNDSLINIGNIPEQIHEIEAEYNLNVITLNALEENDLTEKEYKTFDMEIPVLDTTTISNHEKSLNNITSDIEKHQTTITNLVKKKHDHSVTIDAVMTQVITTAEEELSSIVKLETFNNKQISDIYVKCADYYLDIINQLKTKEEEKFQLKVKLLQSNTTSNQRLLSIKEELESGVCVTCKRPFDADVESYDNHKKQLLAEEQALQILIDTNNIEIRVFDEWFDRVSSIKEKQAAQERLARQEKYIIFESDNKTIQQYKTIIDAMIVNQEEIVKEKNDKQIFISKASNIGLIKYNNYECLIVTADVVNLIEVQKDLEQAILSENECINVCEQNQKTIETKITTIKQLYTEALELYNTTVDEVRKFNDSVVLHNNSIKEIKYKIDSVTNKQEVLSLNNKILTTKLVTYNELLEKRETKTIDKQKLTEELTQLRRDINSLNIKKTSYDNVKRDLQTEYDNFIKYTKNNIIWKIYQKMIKSNFKDIVFEYYRNYLNNTLNYLLSDVNFKLYWDKNSELTMIQCNSGIVTYQSVQQTSGMEITFLGLSLLYTIHVLNVKNSVSHIFLDELSGTLNKGKELSYSASDYQQLFILILSKFTNKTIFIIDHSIDNLFETVCYEVVPKTKYSEYVKRA